MTYGEEIGRVDATNYWYCAWATALVEGESEERNEALAELAQLPETAFYQDGLQAPSRERMDQWLAAAESGDFTDLRQDVEQNCRRVLE